MWAGLRKRFWGASLLVLVILVAGCAPPTAHPSASPVASSVVGQTETPVSRALSTRAREPLPPAGAAEVTSGTPPTPAVPSPAAQSAAIQRRQSTTPGAAVRASSGQPPAFSHIFLIVMENKEASQIAGSQAAPYLNELAGQYGRAANYYAITHPSLPNYLALVGGDTFGVTSDCLTCYVNGDNIADQLEKVGRTWKAYMEDMPQSCYMGAGANGGYAQKHNPFIYFDGIRTDPARCRNIVPLTQLADDLRTGAVPDFVWISPNLCHDMHDCTVQTGDAWLQSWIPKILASSAWKDQGVLFVIFDEGTTGASCCQYAAGGKTDTLVISPLVRPGFVSEVPYDHYSLLRMIEQAWQLPLLGKAGSAATAPMTDFFSGG